MNDTESCIVAPVSAIVTAYRRTEQTLTTLEKIKHCVPPPGELLVHIDGNEQQCAQAIREKFPDVKILLSEDNVGPGGGRNKLIAKAHYDWVASFDDDSYPLDMDYFQRLCELTRSIATASIIAGRIFHRNEDIQDASREGQWQADFTGCGCVYHRQTFLDTAGYVPLPVAYGMEEVDLAIRLHAQSKHIFATDWLRVFHDTTLDHHNDPEVTSASITNQALLTFLRYPLTCWWIGLVQIVKRIIWLMNVRRRKGIFTGLLNIPSTLYALRSYRQVVSRSSVKSYLSLRRRPREKVTFESQ